MLVAVDWIIVDARVSMKMALRLSVTRPVLLYARYYLLFMLYPKNLPSQALSSSFESSNSSSGNSSSVEKRFCPNSGTAKPARPTHVCCPPFRRVSRKLYQWLFLAERVIVRSLCCGVSRVSHGLAACLSDSGGVVVKLRCRCSAIHQHGQGFHIRPRYVSRRLSTLSCLYSSLEMC